MNRAKSQTSVSHFIVKNTLNLSPEMIDDILKTGRAARSSWKNRLSFTSMDKQTGKVRLWFHHADFIEDPEIRDILKHHKAKGDITVAVITRSCGGTRSRSRDYYRFDGTGGLTVLHTFTEMTE